MSGGSTNEQIKAEVLPLLFMNHDYTNSQKKLVARYQTIPLQYQHYTGLNALKSEQQYWTMAAQCSNGDGLLKPNCEPHQMIELGFIKPNQFYGVDVDPIVYQNNSTVTGCNWLYGDLLLAMELAHKENRFFPGVVNVDTEWMPKKAVIRMGRIMYFLSLIGIKDCLLVGNFVLRCRCKEVTIDAIIDELNALPFYHCSMRLRQWKRDKNETYRYNGSHSDRTKMGSIAFYI